jgi:hypothetical protein
MDLIHQVAQLVNPITDLVIDPWKSRWVKHMCASWASGGQGWLMSRAAVHHVCEYDFAKTGSETALSQDDTTMGIILCHTFPDSRFWDSFRFPRDLLEHEGKFSLDVHDVKISCSSDEIRPVRKLVAYHARGLSDLQTFVRKLKNLPENIAFEWIPGKWQLS